MSNNTSGTTSTWRPARRAEPRIFRELLPSSRDVTTALLLDGSSSLGVHGGTDLPTGIGLCRRAFACNDAMPASVTASSCSPVTPDTESKSAASRTSRIPGSCRRAGLGLQTGGYTRLGAPLRHLTSRLLAQPSERRLLIVIGDGLISDEGYEGRYAWADAAHAVEEANDAGVSHVLRRRRPHPGRPAPRSVRAPSVPAHPTSGGASARARPRAS